MVGAQHAASLFDILIHNNIFFFLWIYVKTSSRLLASPNMRLFVFVRSSMIRD
jgi:hypothetical protein